MSSCGSVPSEPQTHHEPDPREELCQNADGHFPLGGFDVLDSYSFSEDSVSSACPSCSSWRNRTSYIGVLWVLRCSEWLLVFGYVVARTLWLPEFCYPVANVF